MKTIETLAAILTASREEYRATATAARQAVRDLETVYRETIEGTPAETIAAAMMEYSPERPEEAEETEEEPEEEAPALLPRVAEILETLPRSRSAWAHGVSEYVAELMEELTERAEWEKREPWNSAELYRWLLNGAADWAQYSWGGCSLIYNWQIAERLCTASELKKTDGGRKDPNPRESWLDVQARALAQAAQRIYTAWTQAEKGA